MSKINLISEIETAMKMVSNDFDKVKLVHYLDDLLSNYKIEENEVSDVPNFNDKYITLYLDTLLLQNYSPHTIKNYGYELFNFSRYINKSILQVKTLDIRNYITTFENIKSSTVVTKLDIISSLYQWLILEDELLKNPCDKIKRPKLPKRVKEGLSNIELEQVKLACKNEREIALIFLMYSTGCRLSEIRSMNIEDINWNDGSVLVIGKGDKERKVFLSDKAMWYLRRYLDTRTDDCEALIVSERVPIRRLSGEGIRYMVSNIKIRANISKPLSPHVFRHSMATHCLDNGMPVEILQQLLGHQKLDTTLVYAKVSDRNKEMAFKRFHNNN